MTDAVLTFFMYLLVVSRLYDPLSSSLQNLAAIISTGIPIERMNEIEHYPVQPGAAELKTQGYELQMNLMSLAGIYGNGIRRRAELFLEKGWYTYVGSDLHRLSVYQHALQKIELSRKQYKHLEWLLANNNELLD